MVRIIVIHNATTTHKIGLDGWTDELRECPGSKDEIQ